MKRIFLIFIFFNSVIYAQEQYTISGIVKDAYNGESLYGATVYMKGTTIGTSTNEYGFFSLTAPKSNYEFIISYVGYKDKVKLINLTSDIKIDVEIEEVSTNLDEIIITADTRETLNIQKPQMSVISLKASTIKQIPVVLGEVDILKSIQLLPGITNSGEGSGGFNVRGGGGDQNLVLLDEAVIYNSSHLFGYFSVFNSDAIKDLKLYKGGIPANFGGRVSSVLDIRQKDGNNKKLTYSGGVGLISSRFMTEGPLFNENSSFIVAGRGSYAHLFLELDNNDNKAYFYDLNLKGNYKVNENNKFYLSTYLGNDVFNFLGLFKNRYGNITGNLRWNHIFNDRLFSNLSIIYSKYDYNLALDFIELDWNSDIKNYNIKYDFKYYLNSLIKIDFGISGIYYNFNPGEVAPLTQTSAINYRKLDAKNAFESAIYLSFEHKISDRLSAQYGLRFSNFSRLGPEKIQNYVNNMPVLYNNELGIYESGIIVGETEFNTGQRIKRFGNLEPRIGFSYKLNQISSIKMSFNRMAQYIHPISNTSSIRPLDIWAPSGKYIKPQLANQYAIGYFRNLNKKEYSIEIESYYKTVDNRLDYIDGAQLVAQNNIETQILSGESRSYGLELLLKKNKGNLTGWLSYTISKSEQRTIGGNSGGLGINDGEWYKNSYDKTHDFSLTTNYKFNDKWIGAANMIFQTGRPVTYPNGQYVYNGFSVQSFEARNSSRLPAYHRLDISAIYRPNKISKGEWNFGIYNVYNRRNAAAISFGQNQETGFNEATRTSIFGIVPSITYNFNF